MTNKAMDKEEMDKKTDAPEKSEGNAPAVSEAETQVMLEKWKERDKFMEGPDRLVDRNDAALVLGISLNWVDKLVAKGFLPSALHQGRRVFSRDRLDKFYEEEVEKRPKKELESDAIWRLMMESSYRSACELAAILARLQSGFFKKTLAGEAIDRYRMEEVAAELEVAEKEVDELERFMAKDASCFELLYAGELALAKAAEKPGYYLFKENRCGGVDKIWVPGAPEKLDYSKQVDLGKQGKYLYDTPTKAR